MRPIKYGKLKKIGPNRWRVIWPKKTGKRKPKSGRPPAPQYPEDPEPAPQAEESTADGP